MMVSAENVQYFSNRKLSEECWFYVNIKKTVEEDNILTIDVSKLRCLNSLLLRKLISIDQMIA